LGFGTFKEVAVLFLAVKVFGMYSCQEDAALRIKC